MSYLDNKIKALLKKQSKVQKEAYVVSAKRQKAHDAISKTIARAILKGSYLSQEIWTIPDSWVDDTARSHFAITMHSPTKPIIKRWGTILVHMKEHCYRVELVPGISIIFGDDAIEIRASDHEVLSAFIKKYGMQVVCPDVDQIVDTLTDKINFVKRVREQLKTA